MRKKNKWAALLLALMMLTGCAQKAERTAPELIEPVEAKSNAAVCAAYIDDIYRNAYYSAVIKPYVEPLSFKVSGSVMSVNGYPGMMVEEGDVLIELDQVSLRERAEQLQTDLDYAQQDDKYTNTIAELDIQILQTELRQLTETETALKEKAAALQEKAAALKDSAAPPEASETPPEETETLPEASETPPETSEAPPETSETPPETSEIPPETSEIPPETSETPSEEDDSTSADEELALVEQEIAQVEEELTRVEKEIALKENEIAQKQALLRQDKEQHALDRRTQQKELNALNASLEDNVLCAPFAGRIVYGDILKPGSWVQAEDPVVFLADDSKLSIECDYIPVEAIEAADRVYAHIGEKEYELRYIPIDPDELMSLTISGAEITSTFEIIASEEELRALEAGQYAAIFLWSDYEADALVVPSGAVMYDSVERRNYVYVDENGTREKRTVEIGIGTTSRVQILEGLEEGDVVYVEN